MVLALCSPTLEEALARYEQANAIAEEDALSGYKSAAHSAGTNLWEDPCMRQHVRAVHGCANSLRKLGQFSAALDEYQLLEREPGWVVYNPYVQWRYHMPDLLLRTGQLASCEKSMMRNRENRAKGFTFISTMLQWNYSFFLLRYLQSQKREVDSHPDRTPAHTCWSMNHGHDGVGSHEPWP